MKLQLLNADKLSTTKKSVSGIFDITCYVNIINCFSRLSLGYCNT